MGGYGEPGQAREDSKQQQSGHCTPGSGKLGQGLGARGWGASVGVWYKAAGKAGHQQPQPPNPPTSLSTKGAYKGRGVYMGLGVCPVPTTNGGKRGMWVYMLAGGGVCCGSICMGAREGICRTYNNVTRQDHCAGLRTIHMVKVGMSGPWA